MHLQELKQKTPADLLAYAEDLEVENASTLRKQDMINTDDTLRAHLFLRYHLI